MTVRHALAILQRCVGNRSVLARSVVAVGVAEAALRTMSPDSLMRWLRGTGTHRRAAKAQATPENVGWAVRVTDRLLPGRSSCLRQSIAAYWLLRNDPNASFFLAARPRGGRLDGHAWVRLGRFEIVPAGEFGAVKPLVVIRSK